MHAIQTLHYTSNRIMLFNHPNDLLSLTRATALSFQRCTLRVPAHAALLSALTNIRCSTTANMRGTVQLCVHKFCIYLYLSVCLCLQSAPRRITASMPHSALLQRVLYFSAIRDPQVVFCVC